MNDIEELNRYFWEESLLPEEADVLRQVGFKSPVDFYDIPYVGLSRIKNLNPENALDILFGMATYHGVPEIGDYDPAGEIDRYVLEMGFNPAESLMSDAVRVYVNVDEILYRAGYNGEETARMTIRQMVGLKHISMNTLQALADTVWLAYVSRYCVPETKFDGRMELLKHKNILFGTRRTEE